MNQQYSRYEFKKENIEKIKKIENNYYCSFCKIKGYLRYDELTKNKNLYYFRCYNCGITNNLFNEIKKTSL